MHPSSVSTSLGVRARLRRRLRWAIPVVILLAIPPTVLAAHSFSDVPTEHPFHTAISNLAGSGVTLGCGGGNYCPSNAVTRDQMAGFLNRGLGRATGIEGTTTFLTAQSSYVATASIVSGNPGGAGFVLVTGSVTAYTDTLGTCPCEVAVYIDMGLPATDGTSAMYFDIADPGTGSATVTGVFPVASGTRVPFSLAADIVKKSDGSAATGQGNVEGQLTLAYFPFGGSGSSTLSPNPTP